MFSECECLPDSPEGGVNGGRGHMCFRCEAFKRIDATVEDLGLVVDTTDLMLSTSDRLVMVRAISILKDVKDLL